MNDTEDLFIDQNCPVEQTVCDVYRFNVDAFEDEVNARQLEHDEAWNRFLTRLREQDPEEV
jgi:hypothetical protein